MVTFLHQGMSDAELLEAALSAYAEPANYQSYEKDIDNGRMVEIRPWINRDEGRYARLALQMIHDRRNQDKDAIAAKEQEIAQEKAVRHG